MTKTNIKMLSRQIGYALVAVVLLFAYFPNVASAQPITNRSVVIGSSLASAYTTYAFTFTVPQATVIKSVGFAACTTASGTCTPAPGFDSSTSTLTSQPSNLDGAGVNTGWTVSAATPTELRLSKSGATVAPASAITVGFSNVKNPTATNSTFYMRVTTYSDAAWSVGQIIDTGVIATSTAGQVTVTAAVDETLTFTLATTTAALGTLTASSTGTGTSSMTVATNAKTGYSVAYSGTTLTSGANTITAMSSPAAGSKGSKQFGMNLMANTAATSTPTVGAAVTGTGTGTPATGYGTIDQFKFNPAGETIASASIPTNSNVFTTSYIANIDNITAPGAYSTIITYVATANF